MRLPQKQHVKPCLASEHQLKPMALCPLAVDEKGKTGKFRSPTVLLSAASGIFCLLEFAFELPI